MIVVKSREQGREHWIEGLLTLPKHSLPRILKKLGSKEALDKLPDPLRCVDLTTNYVVELLENETGYVLTGLGYAGGYNYTLSPLEKIPELTPMPEVKLPPDCENGECMKIIENMKDLVIVEKREKSQINGTYGGIIEFSEVPSFEEAPDKIKLPFVPPVGHKISLVQL